jgi:hypothetical protein
MKMCSISVAPMPSMISMPVASFHSARVAAGSASPADTHLRRLDRSWPCASPAIARYEVGAVNSTLARCAVIAASSASGAAFSRSSVAAPIDSGNSKRPPSPNVNASGGLPVKRSSGLAFRVERGQQSQAAIASRWQCTVPLGTPVVPEVNAISATSSALVSTLRKSSALRAARASSPAAASVPQQATCASEGDAVRAASRSAARRASHSACDTCDLPITVASSPARNSGIVATAMAPAFITANQHAAIGGPFGPRKSTRLPGTTPRSSTSTRAMRLACARRSA